MVREFCCRFQFRVGCIDVFLRSLRVTTEFVLVLLASLLGASPGFLQMMLRRREIGMPVRINILNRPLAEQHSRAEQSRTEKTAHKNLFCCHEIVSLSVFGIGLEDRAANYISLNFRFVKFPNEQLSYVRGLESRVCLHIRPCSGRQINRSFAAFWVVHLMFNFNVENLLLRVRNKRFKVSLM
jgi:hypothetical protein